MVCWGLFIFVYFVFLIEFLGVVDDLKFMGSYVRYSFFVILFNFW